MTRESDLTGWIEKYICARVFSFGDLNDGRWLGWMAVVWRACGVKAVVTNPNQSAMLRGVLPCHPCIPAL